MNNTKEISLDLGYIGNVAEKLQALFPKFSKEENEHGYFLEFSNYSELVVNNGVMVTTNCFESKKHLKKEIFSKLLFNL